MEKLYDYGMLNSQTDPRYAARRYGRFGNIAKNGCGLIALYNVERAARADTRFDRYYAARKPIKTNLFGLLGTRPSTIPQTLEAKGFSVVPMRTKQAMNVPAFDAVIVLYWYRLGAHYVMGRGNPDGSYTFYNQFVKPSALRLNDFLRYLRGKKQHVVRVWGVRFPQDEAPQSSGTDGNGFF